MSYFPSISNQTTSFLEVTSTDVSYSDLKYLIKNNTFEVSKMNLYSENRSQLEKNYTYQHIDDYGNLVFDTLVFRIKENKAKLKSHRWWRKIYLKDKNSLSFPVLPNTELDVLLKIKSINNTNSVHRKRHIAKAISYRLMSSLVGFIIMFFATGSIKIGAAFSIIELLYKPIQYYVHERIWYRWIRFGLKNNL